VREIANTDKSNPQTKAYNAYLILLPIGKLLLRQNQNKG